MRAVTYVAERWPPGWQTGLPAEHRRRQGMTRWWNSFTGNYNLAVLNNFSKVSYNELFMQIDNVNCVYRQAILILGVMDNPQYLRYEINPRDFSNFPIDWPVAFKNRAPLAVEIGCGNGEYLVAWAKSEPSWNIIGIELSLASTKRIQSRIYKEKVQNVRIIRDDARFAMRELFFNNSVHYIMMNFPDPWPKDQHRKRRLLLPDFIETLSAIMETDGMFELMTDQEWYAEDTQSYFEKSNLFGVSDIEADFKREISTKYERKWKSAKRKCFRLQAIKIRSMSVKRIMESEMPHIILHRTIDTKKIIKLKGLVEKKNGSVYKVLNVFKDLSAEAYLLRMVTTDEDYTQNFFILIAPHEKGCIVKIDPGYQPYRTPAVKEAILGIGQQLQT